MAINLTSPFLLSHSSSPFLSPPCNHHHHKSMFLLLLRNNLEPSSSSFYKSSAIALRASTSGTRNGTADEEGEGRQQQQDEEKDKLLLNDEVINRASSLKEATEVLQLIADYRSADNGGVVSCSDCCRIISAAFLCNNSDLALSIFSAMRSSAFDQVLKENGGLVARWKWSRPDLNTYTTLVIGLATSLRVSDALKMVEEICRIGLSLGEEVPFGKIIRCPTCMIAVAVAQPQQGIQVRMSRLYLVQIVVISMSLFLEM